MCRGGAWTKMPDHVFRDRGLTRRFVERDEARYDALCVTVDTAIAGNRERDIVTGMTIPPSFTARSMLQLRRKMVMARGIKTNQGSRWQTSMKALIHSSRALSIFEYVNQQFDPSISWADISWLREHWDGPLTKAPLSRRREQAKALGASAIMVSNRGRQHGSPPYRLYSGDTRCVGNDLELVVDGEIRAAAISSRHSRRRPLTNWAALSYGLAAGGAAE